MKVFRSRFHLIRLLDGDEDEAFPVKLSSVLRGIDGVEVQ